MSRSTMHQDVSHLIPEALLKDTAALSKKRSARWNPALALQGHGVHHSEIFGSAREGGAVAAALALAFDQYQAERELAKGDAAAEKEDQRSILWVQERAAIKANGRPYRPGLPEDLRRRIIHVTAEKPEDVLFALEEGVRCPDFAFVIGEVAGNPRALDFTASRRLSLTAERHGVALWLVRFDAAHDLSSARMRWDVRSAPSPVPEKIGSGGNVEAPGTPSWHAHLFRARSHAPGEWVLSEGMGADRRLVALRPSGEDASPQPVPQTNTPQTNSAAHDQPAKPKEPTAAEKPAISKEAISKEVSPKASTPKTSTTPNPVDLARPTFGRSLAALQ